MVLDDEDDVCLGGSLSIGRIRSTKNVRRVRLMVEEIFASLGPLQARRAYRMREDSFWKLLDLIETQLPSHPPQKCAGGRPPNGVITKAARLSMAIRFFLPEATHMILP